MGAERLQRSWRHSLLILLGCFLAGNGYAEALSAQLSALRITPPKQRKIAPEFKLQDLQGKTLRLSDFRGRPVLINFWATFCAPCREEMPALESLWQEFKNDGLVILAIAADRSGKKAVLPFIQEGAYRFPILLDAEGTVRNRYEVIALPTTYLIGRDGKFIGRAIGSRQWYSPASRELIQSLLHQ